MKIDCDTSEMGKEKEKKGGKFENKYFIKCLMCCAKVETRKVFSPDSRRIESTNNLISTEKLSPSHTLDMCDK